MNFEPQCTEQWQLYDAMAKLLKMCAAAGFDKPWQGVKYCGEVSEEGLALGSIPKYYEFAIAIVEGRPVFRGDVLYPKLSCYSKFVPVGIYADGIMKSADCVCFSADGLSWNPPQRTIEINGVKVKAADEIKTTDAKLGNGERRECLILQFAYESDAEAFKAAMEGKK